MASKSLTGQVAVVTGGSRGIGREIALALARAGAKVAVTARKKEKLDETVALIQEQGGQSIAVVMEVTDAESVQRGMHEVSSSLGSIDLLVNNAGIAGGGAPLWESDIDEWLSIIDVNVRGVFLCSHAVLPAMIERQSGRIINIGSNAGTYPNPMASAYAVSKAALLRLADSLAESAKEHQVNVFTISPGLVLTDMTKDVEFFKDLPASAWTPIEKAGELCVVLASGQADKLTGRFIHVREDDIHDMIERADVIIKDDLYALRLRK